MTDWSWETPSEARLLELYADSMERYGGLASPPAIGCLDRSRAAAVNAGLYIDDSGEPHPAVIAACLLFYLVRNHCFSDGNKRIGWSAMFDMLASLGLTVRATVTEAYDLVNGIAGGSVSKEMAIAWALERLEALDVEA